jgi:RNA polymerase-binding transcription factor
MTAVTSHPTSTSAPASSRVPELRALLEELRADCLREREQASAAALQYGADPVGWARGTSLQRTLEDIDAALSRIQRGTYGTCTGCGRAIPVERLELRPFAGTCVACTTAAR